MKISLITIIVLLELFIVHAVPRRDGDFQKNWKSKDEESDKLMHESNKNNFKNENAVPTTAESETSFWFDAAKNILQKQLKKKINTSRAKNIIFYLGDGMSVPTLMAARTYQGQLEKKSGEEGELFWETFPFSGLSKTWCLDKQVADSACTSTAYMSGVKTNYGTLGINGHVIRGDCSSQTNKSNHVDSILKWAQDAGKSVGFVTTTRVTHASPAGGYAHSADREWESDNDIFNDLGVSSTICKDIALQLITQDPGNKFQVIMGGGRRAFIPKSIIDEEGDKGHRIDNQNLIEQWKKDKESNDKKYLYGWNKTMINEIINNPEKYDYVLGLFESSHMKYHLEASEETEPSLQEMTEAAVKILKKNNKGFVLFVEGGRIDHAHHDTYATMALDETVELAKAVKTGREMTSEDDTLIIVTADHSHTMTVAGYSERGNKIQGMNSKYGDDDLPYMTLSYANGPGYKEPGKRGKRYDISQDDIDDNRYEFPATVPLYSETHGGDDVAIFSSGPWAHLFTGTIEQNAIPHFLAYAASVGPFTLKKNSSN